MSAVTRERALRPTSQWAATVAAGRGVAALAAAAWIAVLARVLGIMLPVMTVGQTWFPYLVAVLREQTGSYTVPLWLALVMSTLGWALLMLLPPVTKKTVVVQPTSARAA